MIATLRGQVTAIDDGWAVVETGGVGYQVHCHLRTLASLHEHRVQGQPVTLHIHTVVSDDAIRLYGFPTPEELRLFRLLLGVERIGPKAALAVLGRAELPLLVRALRRQDAALVSTIPGIGRKTAERIVLELRDRLDQLALPEEGEDGSTSPPGADPAVEGLKGLGFRESDARRAVAAALGELGPGAEVTALVAAALRRLDTASR